MGSQTTMSLREGENGKKGVAPLIVTMSGQMHTVVHRTQVMVLDFVKLEGTDKELLSQIGQIVVHEFDKESKEVVITLLYLQQRIHESFPDVVLCNVGETEFILEYQEKATNEGPVGKVLDKAKLAAVCVITFLGAAFTIMAFHNDISIGGVFTRIYEQLIGQKKPLLSEIEICYSLGIGIGILVFFNHIGKKKITPDPTPIQVEMRKYTKDIDSTFIENASRKGHCKDVD